MQTKCDLCKVDVRFLTDDDKNQIVDGATYLGFWAWMCKPCFKAHGRGYGVGKAQRFDVTSGKKLEG